MSSNVGLSTPRGTGTSGYVQRNLSVLRPRAAGIGQPYYLNDRGGDRDRDRERDRAPKYRKPDKSILLHDRMREIEGKVLALREQLEEAEENGEGEEDGEGKDGEDEEGGRRGKKGLTDDDIEERCSKLRETLLAELEREKGGNNTGALLTSGLKGRGLKSYQVHELAEAKDKESERLRRALGLKGDEAGNGEEHPMARQEKRRREREEMEVREEEGRYKRAGGGR